MIRYVVSSIGPVAFTFYNPAISLSHFILPLLFARRGYVVIHLLLLPLKKDLPLEVPIRIAG